MELDDLITEYYGERPNKITLSRIKDALMGKKIVLTQGESSVVHAIKKNIKHAQK